MSKTACISRFSSAHCCRGVGLEFGLWNCKPMDLKLKPFDFAAAVAKAGLRPDGMPVGRTKAVEPAGSFQATMSQALREVSDSQNESTRLQQELQLGNPTVSLEQTMMAMQKSQIGFQATLSVRNRLVQAYSEIMNMQV